MSVRCVWYNESGLTCRRGFPGFLSFKVPYKVVEDQDGDLPDLIATISPHVRVLGAVLRVLDKWLMLRLRVEGLGLRVQGLGFRV